MTTIKNEGRKVYIEDVRKVSWATGEMCEFASALVSAMICLGENVPYHYVMGTSGVAFRFTLNPGEWDYGNYSIRNVSTDPYAPIRHAFESVGYAYTLCEKGSRQGDTAKIMDSIGRGVPVLAFGVVGPSDCVIITGYDDDGEVLLGWSTFQDIPDDHNIPHDMTGYFRKPGWHDSLGGYILIGPKVARLSVQDIALSALKWAVHLMRTPNMGHKCSGLAALQVWADEMTQDKNFPAGDERTLGGRYLSTTINITMLRDHCSAEPFLRWVAQNVLEFLPEVALAADCFAEVKQLREGMDDLISDNFSEKAIRAIGDPELRRAFANILLQIRAKEDEAAGHMQRLLQRCG
jgi:hypothetical protein